MPLMTPPWLRLLTQLTLLLLWVARPAADQTYYPCPNGCNTDLVSDIISGFGTCEVRHRNTFEINVKDGPPVDQWTAPHGSIALTMCLFPTVPL
jgi:hypothetical protein